MITVFYVDIIQLTHVLFLIFLSLYFKHTHGLSLYSTATQNTWRRGFALGNAPDTRILRWRYQHVGIFWRYLTLKFVLVPTPNPDASQWNIGCVGSSDVGHVYFMYISCIFHVVCASFSTLATRKISRRKGSFHWNMGLKQLRVSWAKP